jgi:hypothetical protein
MVVPLVEQNNKRQAEQPGTKNYIIWDIVAVHVAHFRLQSPRRRRYHKGLPGAGDELQANCVERVSGEGLFRDCHRFQAVIAIKSGGITGDSPVIAPS